MAVRQDVLIFWKREFHGRNAGVSRVEAFCAKRKCHFYEFHTAGVLVGQSCAVKVKVKKFSM